VEEIPERLLNIGDWDDPEIPLVLLFLLLVLLNMPVVVVIRKVDPFVLVLFTEVLLLVESVLRLLNKLM